MNNITAHEILDMANYQWAGTKEIMKLGNMGEARALKIKREITSQLLSDGYVLPRNKIPMENVINYLKINIDYLKKIERKQRI